MKLNIIEGGYELFINNSFFNIYLDNKKEMHEYIKNLILKLKRIYKINIKGFYKIKIYLNKILTYINFIKIDDDNYDNDEIDFRILIIYNKEIYFKYEDYNLINNKNVFYYKDFYYINIDYLDEFIKYLEYGNIVLLDNVDYKNVFYINKKE